MQNCFKVLQKCGNVCIVIFNNTGNIVHVKKIWRLFFVLAVVINYLFLFRK